MRIVAQQVTRNFVVRRGGVFARRSTRVVNAVENVSFSLETGSALGVLGVNGAGKSTLLRMLVGSLAPTSGRILVDGEEPMRAGNRYFQRVGYVTPFRAQQWRDLPALATFELHAALYRIPKVRFRSRLAELVDVFAFAQFLDVPLRELSTGNRTKVDLIAVLLHEPELLVLDEPTIGLDILVKESLYEVIGAARGSLAVVIATHDLGDIEALCSEVVVLDAGRVAFEGAVEGLRVAVGDERKLSVDLADPETTLSLPAGVKLIAAEGRRREFVFRPAQVPVRQVVAALEDEVLDFRVEALDLKQVIARLVAGNDR